MGGGYNFDSEWRGNEACGGQEKRVPYLLLLLLFGPLALVGLRLLDAKARPVVLWAAVLNRLPQSVLRWKRKR